jgi:hypothetical protein
MAQTRVVISLSVIIPASMSDGSSKPATWTLDLLYLRLNWEYSLFIFVSIDKSSCSLIKHGFILTLAHTNCQLLPF